MANSANRVSVSFVVNNSDLTDLQAGHVEKIGRDFCQLMALKYIMGRREHGGNLWDQDAETLVDNAIMEAIDQVVYLITLRDKIRG